MTNDSDHAFQKNFEPSLYSKEYNNSQKNYWIEDLIWEY